MSTNLFDENDRQDFLKLTSDSAIRMAAYTLDEWVANGGTLLGYGQVSQSDTPPEIKILSNDVFLALPEMVSGKPLRVVGQDIQQRTKNINAAWESVKKHPFYAWLISDANYNHSQEIINKNHPGAEFINFRFARLIALHIGFSVYAESIGYRQPAVDRKKITKAKGYVLKLRECLAIGVQLRDWKMQSELEGLLEQLHMEIEAAPRKEKISNVYYKRKTLEVFAVECQLAFGYISKEIIADMAMMLNWGADKATIDRLVSKVSERMKPRLADILLKGYKKSLT